MRIVKLQAENVKKLKAVEIAPEGNVVKITGKNEQGKTTVLDAIWWALGGTKNIQEQPIRTGETKASVTLDLGELLVIRTFTESGSYLKVENKDGASFKSPQAVLDKLIGKFSFDPLAFAKADKKAQVDTLLDFVNITVDAKKLKEISDVEVAPMPNPLDMLNAAYRAVFESRAMVNRDLEKAKGAIASMGEVESAESVSVSELVAEKERLVGENRENDRKRKAVEDKAKDIQGKEYHASHLRDEIKRLQEQLREKEDALALQVRTIEEDKALLSFIQEEVSALQDHDLTDINTSIANADETNRKAQAWRDHQKAQRDLEELQAGSSALTKRLEAIRSYKAELIKSAKFPIDDLDFGNGGVLYQELPFEQASSAQKLQVSLAIAMALNPKLRVIRIDDGSLLDSDHMKVIEEMAKANDFQVWIEVVDESGKVGVYIEDGEVRK